MKTSIKKLAADVAALLGESLSLECCPDESPFPGIEDRVRISAPGILASLLLESDISFPVESKSFAKDITVDAGGVAIIPLPDDFLRLLDVKMSDWKRSVTKVTDADHFQAELQQSVHDGIRGNPDRPVVMLATDGEGRRCLKLFSSFQSARLEAGTYIPYPVIGTDDTLPVPLPLYHSLVKALSSS